MPRILSELLGSEPSPASSATALAANTEDCDHISAFGSASAFANDPSSAGYVIAGTDKVE